MPHRVGARFARLWGATALIVGGYTTAALGSVTPPASAQAVTLVPSKVRTNLPFVIDGAVADVAQVGSRVVVAGTFTQIRPSAGAAPVTQKYLFAYDLETGAFDSGFRPTLDGPVEVVKADPTGTSLFIGGSFNAVSGLPRRKIARLSANGVIDPAFIADASSKVTALEVGASLLWVGGRFTSINGISRGGLAELELATGAVRPGFDLPISGPIGLNGELTVKGLGVTPDQETLVVAFTGQSIGGQSRMGLATVNVGVTPAFVKPWRTNVIRNALLERGGQFWLRSFDMSADGTWFVIGTSGGDAPPINDTVMAFTTRGLDDVQPRWISRHFDSVYATAIDANAVYVGGHFRYQEAPGSTVPYPGDPRLDYGFGRDGIGAGVLGTEVLARLQIGALDPTTGTSLPWNPGSNAFNGVTALTIVPRGLLLGHDGSIVAGTSTGRTAFFDRALATVEPTDSAITKPANGQIIGANVNHTIRGTATSPAGVSRVAVSVRNRRANTYLQANGTWAATYVELPAKLDNAGASVTWRLAVLWPAGAYEVQSRTLGVGGAKEVDRPRIDLAAISSTDTLPKTGAVSSQFGGADGHTWTITGNATDDHGVGSVRVYFRNATLNHYLRPDGQVGDFAEFQAAVASPGATSTTWSLSVSLPTEGNWTAVAKAIDTNSQRDGGGAGLNLAYFGADTPPSAAFSGLANGAVLDPAVPLTITGTASDDRGVAQVRAYLVNAATSQGMIGPGLYGDRPNWVLTTLASPNATTTNWSITAPSLPGGLYYVYTQPVDTRTQAGPQVSQYFTVQIPGNQRPAIATTWPLGNTVTNPAITITGTASDPTAVTRVRVSLQPTTQPGGWLQPDGAIAAATPHFFDATLTNPGSPTTTWSLSVSLPRLGGWWVHAFAVDDGAQTSNPVGSAVTYVAAAAPAPADPALPPPAAPAPPAQPIDIVIPPAPEPEPEQRFDDPLQISAAGPSS